VNFTTHRFALHILKYTCITETQSGQKYHRLAENDGHMGTSHTNCQLLPLKYLNNSDNSCIWTAKQKSFDNKITHGTYTVRITSNCTNAFSETIQAGLLDRSQPGNVPRVFSPPHIRAVPSLSFSAFDAPRHVLERCVTIHLQQTKCQYCFSGHRNLGEFDKTYTEMPSQKYNVF